MSTNTTSGETLLGRIGRALRRAAHNYAVAREIEARRAVFSRLAEHELRDIGVDRFGTPYAGPVVEPTLPVSANDDHEIRRAA